MKTQNIRLALAAIILILTHEGRAQGSLTPPGAPGETMKTLDQIEPRIPIPGGTVETTITAPGSYYLTGNLDRTLTISANNVTLDLMGYTIDPDVDNAIDIPTNQKNITLRNGILTGALIGLDARNLSESNSRFENLTVSDCSSIGLFIGSGCLVENCLVDACGDFGIKGSPAGKLEVRNCRITATTGTGLLLARNSRGVHNTIEGSGNTVSGCVSFENGDDGIYASSGSTVSGCTLKNNTGDGIQVSSDCQVTRCTANSNGVDPGEGAGIHTTGNDNRVDSNSVTDNDRGVEVVAAGNLIIRNSASGNTTNWDVAAGNVCLVVQATTGGAISGNSGGTAPGSTDPNANFTF